MVLYPPFTPTNQSPHHSNRSVEEGAGATGAGDGSCWGILLGSDGSADCDPAPCLTTNTI